MPTIKENALDMIKKLPDDSTVEDIMELMYVEQKILKGQKQLENKQFYTHDEAKEIMKKCLK